MCDVGHLEHGFEHGGFHRPFFPILRSYRSIARNSPFVDPHSMHPNYRYPWIDLCRADQHGAEQCSDFDEPTGADAARNDVRTLA